MSRQRPGSVAAAVGRELLPDFALIGAMKSGTSSLHLYLSDHPQIFMPSLKEIRFFNAEKSYRRGVDWYRQFFRPGLRTGARVFGEATPGYFHHPYALERMKAVIPHARLILLLRDPVKRVYSHYWHLVRRGSERRAFADVVRAHLEAGEPHEVFEASRYADHLERFDRAYGPERIFVGFTATLDADPGALCRAIFAFVGVDPDYHPRNLERKVNEAALPKSRLLQDVISRPSAVKRFLKAWVPAPAWMSVRLKLRRANHRRFVYPPIDPALDAVLRSYYEEADLKLSARVGPLPWRRPDGEQP